MSYSRVTYEDRIEIKLLLQQGNLTMRLLELLAKTNLPLVERLKEIAEDAVIVSSKPRDSQSSVKKSNTYPMS